MVNTEETKSLMDAANHSDYGATYDGQFYQSQDVQVGDGRFYGSQNGNPNNTANTTVTTNTTLVRFWILFVFSIISWIHTVLWNTWGPINESVQSAFPSWGPATVAMTVTWTTIMFMIFVFPMCVITQRFGLRKVMILSSFILFVGTALRCFTMALPWFTVLADLCSILTGISSTVILAGPSLIASDWFPVEERTTAVAVMMGASQLGGIGSYLEPLLVRTPGPGVSVDDIKNDIKTLLYVGAGTTGVLLVTVIIYFPSRPSVPPSVTSTTGRLEIYAGVASLVRNKDFLLLLVAYGTFIGPPIAWIAVLDYSLLPLGFHQNHAMWVGFSSVVASSFFPIFYGRFVDRFRGHLRSNLIALMFLTSLFFYWFLLISYGTIQATTWQVYTSVVGALTFNYTTIPLFYDLAVEISYPVPEILVAGVITAADNMISTFFLMAFLIPNIGTLWMTYTLVLCASLSIVPLLLTKINYRRTKSELSDT